MDDNELLADLAERYFWQLSELFGHEIFLEIPNNKIEKDPSESLIFFQSQIRDCLKCPLGHMRKNFVFGAGNAQADIVFVGEAPGREEDLKGEPFVGKAGQLLDKILAAVKMTRNEVYICNIIKCRPPDNRIPYQMEIDLCLPYLEKQLKLISPKLIVALGATAAHALLKLKTPLGNLRSKTWKWEGFDLLVTYHPAALLRNATLKRPAWEDFQRISKIIGQT